MCEQENRANGAVVYEQLAAGQPHRMSLSLCAVSLVLFLSLMLRKRIGKLGVFKV